MGRLAGGSRSWGRGVEAGSGSRHSPRPNEAMRALSLGLLRPARTARCTCAPLGHQNPARRCPPFGPLPNGRWRHLDVAPSPQDAFAAQEDSVKIVGSTRSYAHRSEQTASGPPSDSKPAPPLESTASSTMPISLIRVSKHRPSAPASGGAGPTLVEHRFAREKSGEPLDEVDVGRHRPVRSR